MNNKYIDLKNGVVIFDNSNEALSTSNFGCIELDDGLVFIDAGACDDEAAIFRKDMEKKFGKKASYLLLTHYHMDNFGGMSAFKDLEIVAAKAGYEEYVKSLKGELSKEQRIAEIQKDREEAKRENRELQLVMESTI